MTGGPFGPLGVPDHPAPHDVQGATLPALEIARFIKDLPYGRTVSLLASTLQGEGGLHLEVVLPTFDMPFGRAQNEHVALFMMCTPLGLDANRTFVMVLATSTHRPTAQGIRDRVRASIEQAGGPID
jgi:hypothetical protein